MTWRDGIEPVKAVYARHCAGCCLHVVMDDGNIEREFLDSQLVRALELGHSDCIAAARLLSTMSLTQVGKLRKRWRYEP